MQATDGPTSYRMLAAIARLVRDTRRAIGWSQAELGRRAGLSQASVSLVERNALPDLTFRSAGRLTMPSGFASHSPASSRPSATGSASATPPMLAA